MADTIRISPLICPQCANRVEFCTTGHIICWNCGELIYDNDLRVWKIRKFCNDYNSRNANKKEEDD